MTLEGAQREAQRRADALGNSYVVVIRDGSTDPNGYIVSLDVPGRYKRVGDRIYPQRDSQQQGWRV